MTEYVKVADGKAHKVADTEHSQYHNPSGHFAKTACGCHLYERQENVDVYMTDETPEVDDLCRNCDKSSGGNELHEIFKSD